MHNHLLYIFLKDNIDAKFRVLCIRLPFLKLLNSYLTILNMNKHGQHKNIYLKILHGDSTCNNITFE